MKRRMSTSEVRVYTFGCVKGPVENAELVYEQMRLAHRYRNALTADERARREDIRRGQAEHSALADVQAQHDAAQRRVDALAERVKEHRVKSARKDSKLVRGELQDVWAGSRNVPTELKDELSEAKRARKELSDRLKTLKVSERDALAPMYERVKETARARRAASAATRGALHFCTYNLVEVAAEASAKKLSKHLSPEDDPAFKRFPGRYGEDRGEIAEGRFGVVSGKGSNTQLTVTEAFSGQHLWLRFGHIPSDAYSRPRGERKRLTRVDVWARVGGGTTPVWARFGDVIFHRQLPKNGRITNAWFKLSTCGTRQRWELQLTVEDPVGEARAPKRSSERTAAINLGWRYTDDGQRVAYLVDDGGREQEVLLNLGTRMKERSNCGKPGSDTRHDHRPRKEGDRLAYASVIRSKGDSDFEDKKESLQSFLEANAGRLDERMEDARRWIGKWRSRSRLAALVTYWASNRIEGDGEIFAELEAWRHHDRHLYQWESNQRDRAYRHRREFYRKTAADLCARYSTIVVGKIEQEAFARKKERGADDEGADALRYARNRAAPSEFVAALKLMASRFGSIIVMADSKNISRTCSKCGHVHEKAPKSGALVCERCGAELDVDANACRNLLAAERGDDDRPQAAE